MHISPGSPNGAFVPIIKAAPNGTLMVMYRHQTAGGINNPRFTQSSNGGSSWSSPAFVRQTGTDIPQVTFDYDSSSVAHAIYRTETNIIHATPNQWPGQGTAIVSTVSDSVLDPDLEVAPDDKVHAVWAQKGQATQLAIIHAYSSTGGASWTISPALSDNAEKSSNPAISVDESGNVYVVWEERAFNATVGDFVTEIRFKKGTWAGNSLTFQANSTTLSDPNINSFRPEVVAANNMVHVSYMRQNSEEEQYAMYTKFNGSTWSTPIDTTNNNPVSVNQSDPFFLIAAMAFCNNNVYLYYHGALTSVEKEQILGSNSDDGWFFREEVTETTTRSVNPSIVCVGDNIYMAFNRIEESGPNINTTQVYFISASGGVNFLPAIFTK
jgi:hypothetical protein